MSAVSSLGGREKWPFGRASVDHGQTFFPYMTSVFSLIGVVASFARVMFRDQVATFLISSSWPLFHFQVTSVAIPSQLTLWALAMLRCHITKALNLADKLRLLGRGEVPRRLESSFWPLNYPEMPTADQQKVLSSSDVPENARGRLKRAARRDTLVRNVGNDAALGEITQSQVQEKKERRI
ncbi:hypothetical protein BX600DRAFT_224565 [Xylariales sp. PMI_506]|nr:hypothetical protein BX600DRAFT_224565 [Xylariales sp. PMI_506]